VTTKRTEVVVELDEVFVIRTRQSESLTWCAECCAYVRMLTPDHAAIIIGHSPRQIYRWIEAGKVHFSEAPQGDLLVCPNSLPKMSERRSIR
jgi:hypothetical protein